MRYRNFLLGLLALYLPLISNAEQIAASSLTDEIKTFIYTQLEQRNSDSIELNVVVSNLDPRLKLDKCDEPLNKRIASQTIHSSNLSIKVSCRSPKPWSIYVPAQIEQYAQVAVVARNLRSGTVLSDADVNLTRMNIAQVGNGYLLDPLRAIGKELKRSLSMGQAVKISHLKEPQIIKRGDKVVLEAGNRAVKVVTSGKALSAGQLGEQIRVRNSKSERVVDATVIAPGRARVVF